MRRLQYPSVIADAPVENDYSSSTTPSPLLAAGALCHNRQPTARFLLSRLIDLDYCRQGAGSAMLEVALKELEECGWRDMILWVLPENRAALAFYERFGFESRRTPKARGAELGRPSRALVDYVA